MEFEYDPAKSAKNLAKHGIDFEAAQRMWDNSKTVTLTAPNPGNDDVRYIVLGMIDGKHWTAITTKRGRRIRIISVRRSRKNKEACHESQKMMPRRSPATSLRRCSTTATTSSAMSISAIP